MEPVTRCIASDETGCARQKCVCGRQGKACDAADGALTELRLSVCLADEPKFVIIRMRLGSSDQSDLKEALGLSDQSDLKEALRLEVAHLHACVAPMIIHCTSCRLGGLDSM